MGIHLLHWNHDYLGRILQMVSNGPNRFKYSLPKREGTVRFLHSSFQFDRQSVGGKLLIADDQYAKACKAISRTLM